MQPARDILAMAAVHIRVVRNGRPLLEAATQGTGKGKFRIVNFQSCGASGILLHPGYFVRANGYGVLIRLAISGRVLAKDTYRVLYVMNEACLAPRSAITYSLASVGYRRLEETGFHLSAHIEAGRSSAPSHLCGHLSHRPRTGHSGVYLVRSTEFHVRESASPLTSRFVNARRNQRAAKARLFLHREADTIFLWGHFSRSAGNFPFELP